MQREDMRLELNKYLDSDEHLLWFGKPRGGIKFSKGDIFMIPFSLVWSSVPCIFGTQAIIQGTDLMFILFLIPFYMGAFYMLIGRFLFDVLRRKNTIYALTENRIIIKSKKDIISLDIKSLNNITLNENTNNRGDIVLNNKFLEDIEEPRKVYKKIIELREKENDF